MWTTLRKTTQQDNAQYAYNTSITVKTEKEYVDVIVTLLEEFKVDVGLDT